MPAAQMHHETCHPCCYSSGVRIFKQKLSVHHQQSFIAGFSHLSQASRILKRTTTPLLTRFPLAPLIDTTHHGS